MGNQKTGVTDSAGINRELDEQVMADYLRRHPGFFADKPALLADLRIPHTTGDAVSLVERQVAVLRERNNGLQKQLDGLIRIARDNDHLNTQLHRLTLQLMQTTGLEPLLDNLTQRLRRDFSADLVALHLLTPPQDTALAGRAEFITDADAFRGSFQRLFGASKPHCGRLKPEQLQILFGEQAESAASSAVLPLGTAADIGLLAIGSADRNRFHTGVDTTFLCRMAEIVVTALRCHLCTKDG
jgi:uncharacterized protein YigA (DUF484 family)